MMKILVTGSNGFLGSKLVERLVARGERGIRCLVRPGSQRVKLDAILAKQPDALEIVTGTLNRRDDCGRIVEGVDVIYHLAAAMGGAPADMFQNSVVASKNLLEALKARGGGWPKIVLCSSFGVYGVSDLPGKAVVDEETPLEPHPEQRDPYSHTKHRQEQLFWQYQREEGLPLVVLRPGVIYGPGGPAMSGRVGLNLFGLFLHLGRNNVLPLSYVDNCAEAFVVAGYAEEAVGQVYNVHDDDLITARQFLKRYRKSVSNVPYLTMPWFATKLMSVAVKHYHDYSGGQLPAVFTPYKSAALWKGNRFENAKLKSLGWQQVISTEEGLDRHFAYLAEKA